MKHYRIQVRGTVQGVFYRASAKKMAETLGINGWCRNEGDGSVFIEAEGDEQSMQTFIKWCEEGSERARVTHVETEEGEVRGFEGFEIRRD